MDNSRASIEIRGQVRYLISLPVWAHRQPLSSQPDGDFSVQYLRPVQAYAPYGSSTSIQAWLTSRVVPYPMILRV